ncbi:hypothetical protein HanXRQr2_Chr08g0350801 [Helianthus annuus]|uniref:Uncharacterized protein n=1 Tax=Helianthus annuus TaxID=4232 RepID=A0A251U8B1_HELAN|nr:hypothetical protein HanXRQr2_Chr08g0350801 [Helianthus annuus]
MFGARTFSLIIKSTFSRLKFLLKTEDVRNRTIKNQFKQSHNPFLIFGSCIIII